jgi:hypothetical protein
MVQDIAFILAALVIALSYYSVVVPRRLKLVMLNKQGHTGTITGAGQDEQSISPL